MPGGYGQRPHLGAGPADSGRLHPGRHQRPGQPRDLVQLAQGGGEAAVGFPVPALAQTDSRLRTDNLDVLLERAERQSITLEDVRSAAAARTLGSGPRATR